VLADTAHKIPFALRGDFQGSPHAARP
jgi:hypothetical protein